MESENRQISNLLNGIQRICWCLCLMLLTMRSFAIQQSTVTGRVTDADGAPLEGVSVQIKGSGGGTVTDQEGKYTIQIGDNGILVFSYVGYSRQEITVGNQTTINVKLVADHAALDEVVVVGYGTQRKTDMTGSVATISPTEFREQPVTRVDQVLQGRATGVQVTNASGAPGSDARIRIRGANSVLGDNNPLYVVDGFVGVDFNTINPKDIESIQILKDAASTAIYGSRGANGVVIITTKKGTRSGFNVTYSAEGSSSHVIQEWDVLGAAEFAEITNERADAMGISRLFTEDQINNFRQQGGTDWQDLVFRQAWGQQHQLNISGGGERTTYMVSGNYLKNDGIINNSGFKRYMLRSNINSNLTDDITIRVNITGSRTENSNTNLQSGTGNPVVQALSWAPTTPAYDENGDYIEIDPVGSVMTSPVALLYDRTNLNQGNFVNAIGGINYKLPVEGLSVDLQYGINYLNRQTQTYNGPVVSRDNPNAYRGSAEDWTLQGTASISYKRVFNDIHSIDAVAVFESQQFVTNNFSATGNGLQFPSLSYNNLQLANSFNVGTGFTKWTLLSYLGRVNYALKDKYLLSFAVRHDGSSKFGPGNKYSTFPTVGVGYNLSEESFIRNMNVFHSLKVRGSWGMTGSQAINPYATLSTYNTDAPVAFDNTGITSGIMLGNPGNPNLRWETTEQVDVGLEASFFEGRLSVEADYFSKKTRDLLLNQALPAYVGGGTLTQNVGEVRNKGVEFALRGVILDDNNWNWTSNFNISFNENKVHSLGGIAPRIGQGTNVGAGMSTTNEFMLIPGYSLGSYWGLKYLGTWKPGQEVEAAKYNAVPGDSRYEDINGDELITTDDFQVIGRGIPATTAGWNNTLSYKDFTLNFFFQGVFGIDKLNYTRAAAMSGSGDARQYILSEIRDRYIPGVNETSDIPAFSSTNVVYTQSSRFIENGNFIRLKNLSLTYKIPTVNRFGISVFVSGTNLLTFTDYKGIDPESSNIGSSTDTAQGIDYGSYPNSRTYTAGVNVSF